MAIAMTGANGFWTWIGHQFYTVAGLNAARGGPATAGVLSGGNAAARLLTVVLPDYTSNTPSIPQVEEGANAALVQWQQAFGGQNTPGFLNNFYTNVRNTLLARVNIDVNGVSATAPLATLIAGLTMQQAVGTLISQMVTGGYYVQPATVAAGAQTAVGSPVGNAVIVVSLKNGQGLLLQLPFQETLQFQCIADSQATGTPAAGNETMRITGQPAISDELHQSWPGGSGALATMSAASGAASNSTGNLLYNSDFFNIVGGANYPDDWVIGIGSAGVDIFQTTSSSDVYTVGGGAVEFLGTGAALLDGITQSFGTAHSTSSGMGGTPATLLPDTVYHVSGWCKLTAASPATGVLQVSLTDGSAYPGSVINDDQSTANSFTVTLTTIADTNWHNFTGVFRTPASLPVTTPVAKLRVRLSTAIEDTWGVFIGRLSMVKAVQPYAGGPFVSIHSGNVNLVNGFAPDTWTVAISNNVTTTGHGLLHAWFERFYGLRALGLQLPYSGSSALNDATYFV